MTTTLKVVITQAWWLKPYLFGISVIGALSGREPDWDKVNHWITRSMRMEIVDEGIGGA